MTFSIDLRSQLGIAHNPMIGCACGRDVNADMMRDVRPVRHLLPGVTADYLCDSCMEHFHRNEILSREEFYRAHSAPAALVALQAARDASIKAARNG